MTWELLSKDCAPSARCGRDACGPRQTLDAMGSSDLVTKAPRGSSERSPHSAGRNARFRIYFGLRLLASSFTLTLWLSSRLCRLLGLVFRCGLLLRLRCRLPQLRLHPRLR